MPVPVYVFKTLPPGLFDPANPQPFRHARNEWRSLGVLPIVDHVTGNGVLNPGRDGTQILSVWPDGESMPVTAEETTTIEIDDELSIRWNGTEPPGPDDLDNGNPLKLATVPIVLADGNIWQIPEIREPRGSLLPTDLVRDRRSGGLSNPIKREYEALWQECEYWFDLKWKAITGEANTFVVERALIFATQVLGLRYRFCDATQSALRVIDSVNVQTVIEYAIGWPAVIAQIEEITNDVQKKSSTVSPASANGSSGQKDYDHNTGPLVASSG